VLEVQLATELQKAIEEYVLEILERVAGVTESGISQKLMHRLAGCNLPVGDGC